MHFFISYICLVIIICNAVAWKDLFQYIFVHYSNGNTTNGNCSFSFKIVFFLDPLRRGSFTAKYKTGAIFLCHPPLDIDRNSFGPGSEISPAGKITIRLAGCLLLGNLLGRSPALTRLVGGRGWWCRQWRMGSPSSLAHCWTTLPPLPTLPTSSPSFRRRIYKPFRFYRRKHFHFPS